MRTLPSLALGAALMFGGLAASRLLLRGQDQASNALFTWIRSLDEPARQPVHFRAVPSFGNTFTITQNLYTVPGGKRLVLEQAAAYCTFVQFNQGGILNADLLATTGGISARFPLNVRLNSQIPLVSQTLGIAGDLVRMYADPGTTAQMAIGFDRQASGQCEISGTGYLVNIE